MKKLIYFLLIIAIVSPPISASAATKQAEFRGITFAYDEEYGFTEDDESIMIDMFDGESLMKLSAIAMSPEMKVYKAISNSMLLDAVLDLLLEEADPFITSRKEGREIAGSEAKYVGCALKTNDSGSMMPMLLFAFCDDDWIYSITFATSTEDYSTYLEDILSSIQFKS